MEWVAPRNLASEIAALWTWKVGEYSVCPRPLHGSLEQIAGRPNYFGGSNGLEKTAPNDLREVCVGRNGGLLAVPDEEVLDFLPSGQPRLVEDDRVVF